MKIPIITYHAIGDGPAPLWTSMEGLRQQLTALAKAGYASVTVSALAEKEAAQEPPRRAFAITFDDGYESVLNARPLLEDLGFNATLYVVSNFAGSDNRWPGQPGHVPPARLLDWEAIGALAAGGWELGSHSKSHPRLSTLDDDQVDDEMARSREEIETRTGASVPTFAFPYGASSGRVRRRAQHYYSAAVGTRLGYVNSTSDRFELPRIDAYYLDEGIAARIGSPVIGSYFFGRQLLRSVKNLVEERRR